MLFFPCLQPPITSPTVCDSRILGYHIYYQVVGTLRRKYIFVPSPGTQVKVEGLTPWLSYDFKVFSVGKYENSTVPAVARVYIEGKGNHFYYLYKINIYYQLCALNLKKY